MAESDNTRPWLATDPRLAAVRLQTGCRVCGFELDEAPWGPDDSSPTYLICPCCGAEAGLDDVTRDAAAEYREEWIKSGSRWFEPKLRPPNWDLQDQLRHVPQRFS